MPRRLAVKPQTRLVDDFCHEIDGILDKTKTKPDIIEFVLSDAYLGRNLYPRQGALLKAAFLQDELFTEWDKDFLGNWGSLFLQTGDEGTQPDLFERIKLAKAEGRPWFREWINIIGRRGSKGYLGAIGAAYVLWEFILKGNPQEFFGIERTKQIAFYVFASKKEAAIANQWGDIYNLLITSRCFLDYLPKRPLKEELVIRAESDGARVKQMLADGIEVTEDSMATFKILPRESTIMAGRGPAVGAVLFDEFAWITKRVAKVDGSELWHSATPALATFKQYAWIYEGSSPWEMSGQFFDNSREALRQTTELDGTPGLPKRPDIFMVQAPGYEMYTDWDKAAEIPLRPNSPKTYTPLKGPQYSYDIEAKRLEENNPEKFRVEYKAKWAAVLDAYLRPELVDKAFMLWPPGKPLNANMRLEGAMNETYVIHCDPSKVGCNTGLAVAHTVNVAGDPIPHVVFDYITHWSPGQFENNNYEIDYTKIVEHIRYLIYHFLPTQVSFDQGYSAWMIQELRRFIQRARLPKAVFVFEKTATAKVNWEVAETTKVALNLGLVHLPKYELLEMEMKFLQVANQKVDHPASGPVTTKDVWDAVSNIVHSLIGKHIAAKVGEDMMAIGLRPSLPGGLPMPEVVPRGEKAPVSQMAERFMASKRPTVPPAVRGGRFAQRPISTRPYRRV